jgi:hypothetical protein
MSVLREANQEVNPKLAELARQGGGGYRKRGKFKGESVNRSQVEVKQL